jgi:hypothetical protein
MSKAASAFSCRRSFVNRNRLSLDSATVFASADVAPQAFLRALIPSANFRAETIVWRYL